MLQHIFKYLKTKKDIQPQSYKQSWAIKEALDAKSLHESGSYINALSLKVDRVIATALSNILNIVDKYCNLQLLLTEDTVIATLWLGIFEDSEIVDVSAAMEFTDSDSNNALFATFQCQFPFFWLLINSIESQWKISAIKSKMTNFLLSIGVSYHILSLMLVVGQMVLGYNPRPRMVVGFGKCTGSQSPTAALPVFAKSFLPFYWYNITNLSTTLVSPT